jgi:hypothetical protein
MSQENVEVVQRFVEHWNETVSLPGTSSTPMRCM